MRIHRERRMPELDAGSAPVEIAPNLADMGGWT
jgi:hypothetical protein